jgi:hypothetical protein
MYLLRYLRINEEALLLAKYLRGERKTWGPRVEEGI